MSNKSKGLQPSSERRNSDEKSFSQSGLLGSDLNSVYQANIMMIDDEAITMEIMKIHLQEVGYQNFNLVEDSKLAIATINEYMPDLVILDLVMPDVSGFDILQELRQTPEFARLPVIILTSSVDAETKIRALDLGATDFLAKPVDTSELQLRIRNTLEAKAYQDQLAYYDDLTKLPNRSLFIDRLNWLIQQSERSNHGFVLLHILFSQLDDINDAFGHKTTDYVIQEIAVKIKKCIRETDSLALSSSNQDVHHSLFRTSGEGFSVLCMDIEDPSHSAAITKRIIEAMRQPINVEGTPISVLPNVGIAVYPEDETDSTRLIKASIHASNQACQQGLGGFEFYSQDLNNQSYEKLKLESEIRQAIINNEFSMYYQPKVDVATGKVLGAEALIRWQKPDGQMMYPDKFIPLAEETGLIIAMEAWTLRRVCEDVNRLIEKGFDLDISINISAKQFENSNLCEIISHTLETYHTKPQNLTLEMTESQLLTDPELTEGILKQLVDLGTKISIDDFGTGYSSLVNLKKYPLHELKIDRSFIQNLHEMGDDYSLVSAVIILARFFDLKIVAEGVEEQEQLDILADLGCDVFQGYLFSKAISFDDFVNLLVKSQ